MNSIGRRLIGASLAVLALGVLPGVAVAASASPDPSIVVATPWLRVIVAFLLVLPFGSAVLSRYDGLLDRSVDASMESPFVSLVYGVGAHLAIFFAAGVFSTQLATAGIGEDALFVGSTVVLGAILLTLAGLGFAVVGTVLTDIQGQGRPWTGLVVAAAVGAIGLLVVPVGIVLWVLVVSIGIGGPTRRWVHAERTVDSEAEA